MVLKLNQKDWICIAMLIVVPLTALFAVFIPRNKAMEQVKQRITERSLRLRQMGYVQAERQRIEQEMQRCQLGLDYFLARLPSDKYVDQVVRDIWSIANQSNIQTLNIRTLTDTQGPSIGAAGQGDFAKQLLAVTVRGDFRTDFFGFLAQLERASRITRIHDMDISRSPDESEGTVDATMTLSVFYQN